MVVELLRQVPRLNVILVELNVKLFFLIWDEVAYVNYIHKWKTTARYEHFIVMEDQEYFIADFL